MFAITGAAFFGQLRLSLHAAAAVPASGLLVARTATFEVEAGDVVGPDRPDGAGRLDAGEEHRFTFSGELGDVVYLRAAGGCDDQRFVWHVRRPDGGGIGGVQDICADVGRIELTQEGPHSIVVQPRTDAAGLPGTYGFEVVASRPDRVTSVAVGDRVQGHIDAPGAWDVHQLDGRAGQVLVIRAAERCATEELHWLILRPDGSIIGGIPGICMDIGEVELTQDGTYAIEVRSRIDSTGRYSFSIEPG